MHDYSTAVAIFDFVPVLITALGLACLAQAIAQRHPALMPAAWIAALLIPLGGLCKASWKLIVALSQQHIAWLENLLFIALAPGFVLMAFCLFHARKAWQAGSAPRHAQYSRLRLLLWLSLPLAGALIAAVQAPQTRLWFFWLLGATTLANATLLWHAIAAARHGGLRWPVLLLFVYNFVATLALSRLSRLPPSEFTAWTQELVNLSAQLALALGLWRLSRRMRQDHPTPHMMSTT